jgi:hypothetical protein
MRIHLHLHEVCCCESREVWLLACVVQVTLTRKGEDLPGIKELEFSPMDHHLRVTVLVRALVLIDVPARLGNRSRGVAGLWFHPFSCVGLVMLKLSRVG